MLLRPPNLPGWDARALRAVLERRARPAARSRERRERRGARGVALRRRAAARATSCYLTMSTGVGGGLSSTGASTAASSPARGRSGHIPVEWDGEPCACGLRGCARGVRRRRGAGRGGSRARRRPDERASRALAGGPRARDARARGRRGARRATPSRSPSSRASTTTSRAGSCRSSSRSRPRCSCSARSPPPRARRSASGRCARAGAPAHLAASSASGSASMPAALGEELAASRRPRRGAWGSREARER